MSVVIPTTNTDRTRRATSPPPVPRRRWPRLAVFVALGVVFVGGGFTAGTLPRWRQQALVKSEAAAIANAPPRVLVVNAREAPLVTEQVLPGNSFALTEAGIHA